MRRLVIGAVGSCAIAGSAYCAPLHPYIALNLPDTLDPHLTSEPVTKIQAGPQPIQLEVTSLKTVRAGLGGTIQFGGDAGGAASWLCFTGTAGKTPVIFWFISNAEMGGGSITEVAIQRNAIGTPEGCSKAPSKLTTINFGVPSFGASQRTVIQYFGGGEVDHTGLVSYASEHPAKGPPTGCTRLQGVRYFIPNGQVSTISVSQVTSC